MEVYGTKPKMFTKEWRGYFWDYYKWHTIGGLFAAGLIIYSCVQCATAVQYDLQVDYISENGILEETRDALTELIKNNIDDANGNDSVDAFVLSLNMAETQDVQMTQAMQTKMMLEQGYSESFVFILSKKYADIFTESEVLENNSVWAGDRADEACVVSLDGSSVLEEFGIDTSDLYIGVRKMRSDEQDKEEKTAEYKNGIKLAQYLIQ